MEELRLTFLIFGGVAIVGILAHGLWTVRKQRQSDDDAPKKRLQWRKKKPASDPDSDFDAVVDEEKEREALGLGPVRTVRREPVMDEDEGHQPNDSVDAVNESHSPDLEVVDEPADSVHQTHPAEELDDSIPEPPSFMLKEGEAAEDAAVSASPAASTEQQQSAVSSRVSQEPSAKIEAATPKPSDKTDTRAPTSTATPEHRKEPSIGEPLSIQEEGPSFTASATDRVGSHNTNTPAPSATADKATPDADKQNKPKARRKPLGRRGRQEPKVGEDQMNIFDETEGKPQSKGQPESSASAEPEEQEVLVLNVKTPEGKPITGDVLLPALLTLGFKFGEQDIFHRHVNSNGKGPVLFSLANMFKPGVFDVDNMEHFTTQGISLFMILPIDGDPHQVFNMMHNAARKLADEFGAQVLDGRRSTLTKQAVQQYVEKIREFERRRMTRRNR